MSVGPCSRCTPEHSVLRSIPRDQGDPLSQGTTITLEYPNSTNFRESRCFAFQVPRPLQELENRTQHTMMIKYAWPSTWRLLGG